MSNRASETSTIERLRQAAAALHAIAGLGLRLHQTNRPTLRIARCGGGPPIASATALSPCELRAVTIALTQGCRGGARQIVDPSRDIALEWFSTHDVAIGPFDVFQVTLAADVGAFVFAAADITATQAAVAPLLSATGSPQPCHSANGTRAGVPVELRHDAGLDVSLVGAYYDPTDPESSAAAAMASFDLLASIGADRVEAHASTGGGR